MAPPRKMKTTKKSAVAAPAEAAKEIVANEEIADTKTDAKDAKKSKKPAVAAKRSKPEPAEESGDASAAVVATPAATGSPAKSPKPEKAKSPKLKRSLKAKRGSAKKGAKKTAQSAAGKDDKKSKRGKK